MSFLVDFPAGQTDFDVGTHANVELGDLRQAGVHVGSEGLGADRRFGWYCLVLSLRGQAMYRDETGTEESIHPGDVIVVLPDLLQWYGPDDGVWDSIFLSFDGLAFRTWEAESDPLRSGLIHRVEPLDQWFRRFLEIAKLAHDPLRRCGMLLTLLADILDCDEVTDSGDSAWLQQAEALIASESTSDADWEAIAYALSMSYEQFRKRFRQLAGMPPGRYHDRVLMQRAGRLLRDTDDSIAAVSRQLNFCDPFHFSRRFKQVMGLSPRDFRRPVV